MLVSLFVRLVLPRKYVAIIKVSLEIFYVQGYEDAGLKNHTRALKNVIFLSDATLIPVGASPPELIRASIVFSSPNSGIYIMPMFKFPADGIVAGFEVFVTKVGFLRFQVKQCTDRTYIVRFYL